MSFYPKVYLCGIKTKRKVTLERPDTLLVCLSFLCFEIAVEALYVINWTDQIDVLILQSADR
jgi:hypothetical protein